MSQEFSQQLKDFIKTLQSVKVTKQENSNLVLPDLGLIIQEGDAFNPDDFANFLGDITSCSADLDQFSDEIFLKKLVEANSAGKWLVVNCVGESSPNIAQILNQINNGGEFTLTTDLSNPPKKVTINQNTRIVVIVKNDILEGFTNPYFLNLFGPILRVK